MKNTMKLTIVAAAVASVFSISAQASTMHIGSATGIEASILDSGNFDTFALEGALGLAYKGNEWVNWGTHSSWGWLNANGTSVNTLGADPLGTSNLAGDGTNFVLTGVFGSGLTFTQTMTRVNNETIGVQVSLTNNTGSDVTGVQWGVGLDPDVDRNVSLSGYATHNTILGQGAGASVVAEGLLLGGHTLTLENTTSAGAHNIAAFINGPCCTPVDPTTAFAGAQFVGFNTTADNSISLAYDIGTMHTGDTKTIGYQYVMAVPEPETYAMFLAGLGLMGFMARRRSKTS